MIFSNFKLKTTIAKKSYIVSCFEAVVEDKIAASNSDQDIGVVMQGDCQCYTYGDGTFCLKDIEEKHFHRKFLSVLLVKSFEIYIS